MGLIIFDMDITDGMSDTKRSVFINFCIMCHMIQFNIKI